MSARTTLGGILVAAALALPAAASSSAEAPPRPLAPLEGTAWKLLLDRGAIPDGFWSSDLLVFGHGVFAALECVSAGFRPAAYRAEAEGGRVRWSACLARPDGS